MLLSGRSVALVGPAGSLDDSQLGKYIDSFDLVARVNRGLEPVELVPNDVGQRTDILFSCLIENPRNAGDISIERLKSHNVSWVACFPHTTPEGELTGEDYSPYVKRETVQELKNQFHFHDIHPELVAKVNKAIQCRANTGYFAIMDLLLYPITKLFICGFTFYLDGFMGSYKPDVDSKMPEEWLNSTRHIQKNMWQVMKKVKQVEQRIECDNTLEIILGLDTFSIERYQEIMRTSSG